MDKKIQDKIRKLLAVNTENGATDNESFVAFQKAQALMAQYKISEKDLNPEEVKKCIRLKTSLSYGSRSSDHYLSSLAHVIADNFCCVHYVSTPHRSQTHEVCFMGFKEDVEIADEVLVTANQAIIRGYNKVWYTLRDELGVSYVPAKVFNPYKIGYVKGYIKGMEHALETQKGEHQEWGLVLVAPEEAQNFIAKLTSSSFGSENKSMDRSFFNQGYEDGANFSLKKKISKSDESFKLEA